MDIAVRDLLAPGVFIPLPECSTPTEIPPLSFRAAMPAWPI
jgi:hypothetical protein